MIAGTEQIATEEPSLPRMSDGEDNDDLYDYDAPSEESERDEDSPQRSRRGTKISRDAKRICRLLLIFRYLLRP